MLIIGKVKNLISAIFLKIVLDLVCVSYLCEVYDPFAFILQLNTPKILQSYLFLAIVVILIPNSKKNISSLVIWLFITIQYIPSLTIYGLGNESPVWILYVTLFWISTYSILEFNKYKYSSLQPIKIYGKNNRNEYDEDLIPLDRRVWFCILFILGYTYIAIATLPNIKFAIDFTDIYDVRSSFQPILPFAAYLITWAIYVINPLLIVYFGFVRKNRNLAILSCASQFFLYIGNGQKTTLFSIPLLLIIIFFWGKGKISFCGICACTSILLITGYLTFFYYGDVWSSAIFASRMLILPAVTDYYYYDFFFKHPPIMLSHGHLGFFLPYKFDIMPWFLIGRTYMSNPDLSMNSGMLGDSYMNFKEFGLILNSFLFSMLLVYVDKAGFKKNQSLILACTLMPFIWCLNGSFYSLFTTGGMGIGLLLVSRIPDENA